MKTGKSTRVPDEILLHILKEAKLDPLQLVKISAVSKQFDRVSATNDLWQDETPSHIRRAVAQKRAAEVSHEGRSEYKAAFLDRIRAKSPQLKKAYLGFFQSSLPIYAFELLGEQFFQRFDFGGRHDGETVRSAQGDYDLVKHFVSRWPMDLKNTFIEDGLRKGTFDFLHEPAIALDIIRSSPKLFGLFNSEIKDSEPHVMASFRFGSASLKDVSERLQNKERIKDFAAIMGAPLHEHVSEQDEVRRNELLKNPEMAILALKGGMPYWLLPRPTSSMPEVLVAGINNASSEYSAAIGLAINGLRANDRQFMRRLIRDTPDAAMYLGEDLRRDLPFMREIAAIAPQQVIVAGGPAARDAEAVRIIITTDIDSGMHIYHADLSLRKSPSLQKLAFQYGASVDDLNLKGLEKLKAWFIYKKVTRT